MDTAINMAIDLSNILKSAKEPAPLWATLSRLELASKVCSEIKEQVDKEYSRLYQVEYGDKNKELT